MRQKVEQIRVPLKGLYRAYRAIWDLGLRIFEIHGQGVGNHQDVAFQEATYYGVHFFPFPLLV